MPRLHLSQARCRRIRSSIVTVEVSQKSNYATSSRFEPAEGRNGSEPPRPRTARGIAAKERRANTVSGMRPTEFVLSGGAEEALAEFQHTMRDFLSLQRRVMTNDWGPSESTELSFDWDDRAPLNFEFSEEPADQDLGASSALDVDVAITIVPAEETAEPMSSQNGQPISALVLIWARAFRRASTRLHAINAVS